MLSPELGFCFDILTVQRSLGNWVSLQAQKRMMSWSDDLGNPAEMEGGSWLLTQIIVQGQTLWLGVFIKSGSQVWRIEGIQLGDSNHHKACEFAFANVASG